VRAHTRTSGIVMRFHISDWQWACITAAGLMGVLAAVAAVTVLSGGFEAQVAWLLTLLPGLFLTFSLSNFVYGVAPHAKGAIFWVSTYSLNFVCYWTVCYVVIKIRRSVRAARGFVS
jgi:hypothetical protein